MAHPVTSGSRPVTRPDRLPAPHPPVLAARARDLVADFDQVRTWSDPAARQCELARIGAAAVELLRHLDTTAAGGGGR